VETSDRGCSSDPKMPDADSCSLMANHGDGDESDAPMFFAQGRMRAAMAGFTKNSAGRVGALLLLASALLALAAGSSASGSPVNGNVAAAAPSIQKLEELSVQDKIAQEIKCKQPTCAASKEEEGSLSKRPLCKSRRLAGSESEAEDALRKFVSQRSGSGQGTATLSPEDKIEQQLKKFLSGDWSPGCIQVSPVLKLSTAVNMKVDVGMPVEFLQPMFLRAYSGTVSEALGVPLSAVWTRLVSSKSDDAVLLAKRRLALTQDEIPEHLGNSFTMVAIVTNPPATAIMHIEDVNFVQTFSADVRNDIDKEGSQEGAGNIQSLATVGSVVVTETDTMTVEANFKSMGFGTVCRKDSADESPDDRGHAQVLTTKSLHECSEHCHSRGDRCFGFEFRHSEARCELWPEAICKAEAPSKDIQPNDFECFTKCV